MQTQDLSFTSNACDHSAKALIIGSLFFLTYLPESQSQVKIIENCCLTDQDKSNEILHAI